MKYSINAPASPKPYGHFSQGTTAGRMIYVSGQVAVDELRPSTLIKGDVCDQCSRCLDLIEIILSGVNLTLVDVCQTTVYLKNLSDLSEVDAIFAKRFGKPAPARSVVGVDNLPLGAYIEIDCVACR